MNDETIVLTSKSKEQKLIEREEKRLKVSKGYYDIPEEEMQLIIKRAQTNSLSDQQFLLEVFGNFLEKYVNMLNGGYYDLRDYDIKHFVLLWIGNPMLKQKIKRNQMSTKSYKEVTAVMKGIIFMIKRYNDENDIRQTVNAAFMYCVSIYRRRGEVPFSGYLYYYYKFVLQKYVKEFLIDQLGMKSFALITDDEVSSSFQPDENAGGVYEATIPRAPRLEDMLGIMDIDEAWVNGDGAQFPFNELKKFERQLLKWRYVDGLRPNKIAEKTSDHPNTCRQHIKAITTKLMMLLEQEQDQL